MHFITLRGGVSTPIKYLKSGRCSSTLEGRLLRFWVLSLYIDVHGDNQRHPLRDKDSQILAMPSSSTTSFFLRTLTYSQEQGLVADDESKKISVRVIQHCKLIISYVI
ncbi:hypothetical protein Bca4012_090084 [Brassica carinata]